MSTYNLIVYDSECENAAESFKIFMSLAESTIESYRAIIGKAASDSIPSGEVHDALVVYSGYLEELSAIVEGVGSKFNRIVEIFLSDIKKTGHDLYDSSAEERDFSQKEYDQLQKSLRDPWCSITDDFSDFFFGVLYKAARFVETIIGFSFFKKCLDNNHVRMLDYNNVTKKALRQLFDDVHEIDRSKKPELAVIKEAVDNLGEVLGEMAEIIDPGNGGSFTVVSVQTHVGGKMEKLRESFDHVVEITDREADLSIGEISDFASQPWALTYFDGHLFLARNMILDDIGGVFSAAGITIFQGFDIFETEARNHISHNNKLSWLYERIFGVSSEYGSYEERKIKSQIMEAIEDSAVDSVYGKEYEQCLKDFKDIAKFAKKYGKNAQEFLTMEVDGERFLNIDPESEYAKKLKAFLGMGNTTDILKYGDKGAEILAHMFNDYDEALKVLDSFEKNGTGSDVMAKCLGEIRLQFNKQYGMIFKEIFETVEDFGMDKAIDALSKANPVLGTVNIIKKGIGTVGELTGLSSHTKAAYDALVGTQVYSETSFAYRKALERVRITDPADDHYAEYAKDLENCFNLNRNALEGLFKSMAKATNGNKSSYYKYCAKEVSMLSMHDGAAPDILSYDDFVALTV